MISLIKKISELEDPEQFVYLPPIEKKDPQSNFSIKYPALDVHVRRLSPTPEVLAKIDELGIEEHSEAGGVSIQYDIYKNPYLAFESPIDAFRLVDALGGVPINQMQMMWHLIRLNHPTSYGPYFLSEETSESSTISPMSKTQARRLLEQITGEASDDGLSDGEWLATQIQTANNGLNLQVVPRFYSTLGPNEKHLVTLMTSEVAWLQYLKEQYVRRRTDSAAFNFELKSLDDFDLVGFPKNKQRVLGIYGKILGNTLNLSQVNIGNPFTEARYAAIYSLGEKMGLTYLRNNEAAYGIRFARINKDVHEGSRTA